MRYVHIILFVVMGSAAQAQDIGLTHPDYALSHFLRDSLLTIIALGVCTGSVYFIFRRLNRIYQGHGDNILTKYMIMVLVILGATLVLIITLPFTNDNRSGILTILGIAVSALIAMSSTTLLSNAISGVLLRPVWHLKPGDYFQMNELFGRITHVELLRVSLVTETGVHISIPAHNILTQPSSTFTPQQAVISVDVSLGFDADIKDVKLALAEAAKTAGLSSVIIHVLEIGDFSILYQVLGKPQDPTHLMAGKSTLAQAVIKTLNTAGIEIASPHLTDARIRPSEARYKPNGNS